MSSSGGSANPAYLSQGTTPMPNIPIAGQAGELKPQERGSFQEFLPEIAPAGTAGNQIMPAGQGPNPSATGLTAEMFKYRSPSGILAQGSNSGDSGTAAAASSSSDVDAMRQQLAALQTQVSQTQQPGFGQYAQQSGVGFPINWTNSNVPNATS